MNDALRAEVFARDKGICSFSGLSVWYLDYGTAPFSHADWVDHIRPKSRGGKDTLENLVCASYFYNRKKLNNGSDCQYLFSKGKPTKTFFWTHGELSLQQAMLLKRHAAIEKSDWYFNRAIFNIMVAIDDELSGIEAVRTRQYWFASAHKRMTTWRKMTDGNPRTLVRRGLARFAQAEDVHLMLSLADAPDASWIKIYQNLLRLTRQNENVLGRFWRAKHKEMRVQIVHEAVEKCQATAPLIETLMVNLRRL